MGAPEAQNQNNEALQRQVYIDETIKNLKQKGVLDEKGEADLRAQDPIEAQKKLIDIEFCMDEIPKQMNEKLMTREDSKKILSYGPEIARAWLNNNRMIPDLLRQGIITLAQANAYKAKQKINFKIRPLKTTLEAHVFVHEQTAALQAAGKLSPKEVARLRKIHDPLDAKAQLEASQATGQVDQTMVNVDETMKFWEKFGEGFKDSKPEILE